MSLSLLRNIISSGRPIFENSAITADLLQDVTVVLDDEWDLIGAEGMATVYGVYIKNKSLTIPIQIKLTDTQPLENIIQIPPQGAFFVDLNTTEDRIYLKALTGNTVAQCVYYGV
jgi:hypothetical protein